MDESKKPKEPSKLSKFWTKFKFKTKELSLKILSKIRTVFNWIINTDVDFVFVFAASFVLTIPYLWWHRLIFSIGITFIYKLIVKDIIRVKTIMRGK